MWIIIFLGNLFKNCFCKNEKYFLPGEKSEDTLIAPLNSDLLEKIFEKFRKVSSFNTFDVFSN